MTTDCAWEETGEPVWTNNLTGDKVTEEPEEKPSDFKGEQLGQYTW
jgi:hypothetical protein